MADGATEMFLWQTEYGFGLVPLLGGQPSLFDWGSYGNSMFNILSNCLFSEVAVPLNILISKV